MTTDGRTEISQLLSTLNTLSRNSICCLIYPESYRGTASTYSPYLGRYNYYWETPSKYYRYSEHPFKYGYPTYPTRYTSRYQSSVPQRYAYYPRYQSRFYRWSSSRTSRRCFWKWWYSLTCRFSWDILQSNHDNFTFESFAERCLIVNDHISPSQNLTKAIIVRITINRLITNIKMYIY